MAEIRKPEFIFIDPKNLHNVWATHVSPRLKELINEGENPDGWNPDHIYEAVKEGKATLILMSVPNEETPELENSDDGFIIVQVTANYACKALHIWIAYSKTKKNVMMTFNDQLNELAGNADCSKISFSSTRDFWQRVAPRFGFGVERTVYHRDVTPKSE